MGGTGATAYWICQEQIRNQRKQDAQMRRNREQRRAIRRIGMPEIVGERHSFPCAHACTSCGWIVPPAIATGDPMRTDPTTQASRNCPCCGGRELADLADAAVGLAMVDAERVEMALRRTIVPATLHAIGVVALATAVVLGILAAVAPLMLVTSVLVMVGVMIAIVRRVVVGLSTPKRTAWRWHAPTRRYRAGRVLGRGTVDGDGVVTSPLSGRNGIAWRIEVRYPGDRGDAFALVEQGAARLSIDGEAIGREPTIALGGEPVDLPAETLARFLVSRGVDACAGAIVTETIVASDTTVVVRRDRLGGPVVLCAN